jgi:F-type H+-transporting ATPase subunit b
MKLKAVAAMAAALSGTWLALPPALLAADEGGGGLFSINLGLSIWTVVVFLVLVFLLGKFAWGPILASVDARERGIQESLDEAARMRAEAIEVMEEHKRQLADSRRQAQQIIAESREAGEQLRREIEEEARKEGQRTVERAKKEIEREKDAAVVAVRREAVEIAIAAAARIIHERLDAPADRELIGKYLDEVEPTPEARA